MALTALEIKHAKEGMHSDGNGVYLLVKSNGTKFWIFRYQNNGKRREMGLGSLADKSAVDARAEAADLKKLVRSGIDPIEDRKAKAKQAEEEARRAKKEAKRAADKSDHFRKVAENYIEGHRGEWKNDKHIAQWSTTIETYVNPVIGDKRVSAITTEDVLAILQPIWLTKTETASRVRSRIELILSYAKALKLRQGENPAIWRGHLDAILPKPTKLKNVRHFPALPYAKAPDFMVELRTVPGFGARALEFAILTATRSGEVRLATWKEIDLKNKLWTIPADRMKAKREHWVPLSDAAIKLLESMPRIDDSPYLFPGERSKRPLSDMSLTAVIRRMNETENKETPPEWIDPTNDREVVPHGFRSTFRDWAAEVGHYPRELAEHALAHSLPDRVEAAYQRGTMLERRRPMMQAWADYLAKDSSGKVLPFPAKVS